MLFRALERSAKRYGTKPAIIGDRRRYTFQQLLDHARCAAAEFQQAGLGAGDTLVCGIPPCPEFYALFFGASALGITTIPVAASGKLPGSIKGLETIAVAGPSDFLGAVAGDAPPIRHTIVWQADKGLLIGADGHAFVRRNLIRQEAVLAVSSSGTTGEPVLFRRSAETLYRRARLGAIAWQIRSTDTLVSTGPFTSGANTNYHLALPVIQGATIVVLENFHRRKLVEAIERERATVLFAVPMVFDVLSRLPSGYPTELTSLRRCISGGTHLPQAIYDEFYRRFGRRIEQGYGGSHFAPAFTVNGTGVPGAVGRKDGLFPVRIVNAKGRQVGAGVAGEIAFDISKAKYAWTRSVLRRNPHRRGNYVLTGDLGRLDKHGNLFVVGRKSALIKVGANRVVPAEVEEVLRSHPQVHDAVVFALRAGQTDEAVGAVVVRSGSLSRAELIEHCARKLDPYKIPRSISFRKSLPRNTHGKIIRYVYDKPGTASKAKLNTPA